MSHQIKFPSRSHVEALRNLCLFNVNTSRGLDFNLMVNSLNEDLYDKLDKKLEKTASRYSMTIRDHEVVSICAVWLECTKHDIDFQSVENAMLMGIIDKLQKAII